MTLTAWSVDERERARRQADAAKLADLGITSAEASLFNVIHYGLTVPPADLCGRATVRDYCIGNRVTFRETEASLTGCLAKGWLQVVDEAVLASIRAEVERQQLVGPIYGYPSLGGVDFTPDGAEQWLRLGERLWGRPTHSFAYCDTVHLRTGHYFASEAAARAEVERQREYGDVVAVTAPIPIGPWRAEWWRRFPEGYRIEVEERMRWQGRAPCGGGSVWARPREGTIDLAHAQHVLDQHKVEWIEWLVLASVETAPNAHHEYILDEAAKVAERLGATVSVEECSRGLEACVSKGWLRPLDSHAVAEIVDLLADDAAWMPVPFDPRTCCDELAFSLNGAQLFRRLSATILGADWEELAVEDTFYREEHHYSPTQAGVAGVIQSYVESNEEPTSVRIESIGPWCVYWWERFPSGYRLELRFGEEK